MEVDVVVTTFNRTEYVHEAVGAIWRFIPHRKIIVVDGSTDFASQLYVKSVARKFGAEYHEGPVAIGGKVYIGAQNAETEWILVCSDDTILTRHYWPAVLNVIDETVGFIAPNAQHGFRFPWWQDFYYWFTKRPFVCAGSYVVRRKLVLACMDLLDMNLSEDSYIRDYVVSRGYEFVPLEERVAVHDPRTPSELLQRKRAWEYGRHYGMLPPKHGLRMSLKFALAKVRQIAEYTRERGFSLPVALFQMLQVVIMGSGVMGLLRPPTSRSVKA